MKKLIAILVISMSAFATYGQVEMRLDRTAVDPTSVDGIKAAGKFTATGYENPTLGFSITAPVGFERAVEQTSKQVLDTGREMVKEGKSASTAKDIDKSVSNTRVLFQYNGPGAVLSAGIEKIPAGYTSKLYAESNISMLKGVSTAKLSKPLNERSLGGRIWQAFEVELTTNGGIISQLYLMRVDGRNAIFFVGSIGDPESIDAVVASLNSLKFKN
ncbi:MAG: hypothetical protein ABL959_03750 [Pyrinomonadaceae bacterium]